MKIEFIKNLQFTRLVKTDGQLREFNFRRVNSSTERKFVIDVSDDRGNRIVFGMRKEENGWKLLQPETLPQAFTENENVFNDLIEEELQKV